MYLSVCFHTNATYFYVTFHCVLTSFKCNLYVNDIFVSRDLYLPTPPDCYLDISLTCLISANFDALFPSNNLDSDRFLFIYPRIYPRIICHSLYRSASWSVSIPFKMRMQNVLALVLFPDSIMKV